MLRKTPQMATGPGGIVEQYSRRGMASLLLSVWHDCPGPPWLPGIHEGSALQGVGWSACVPENSFLQSSPSHGFMDRLPGARQRTWDGLHVSPRTAPSKGTKLCTYHHWFGQPNKIYCEPYHELPKSSTKALGPGAAQVGVT